MTKRRTAPLNSATRQQLQVLDAISREKIQDVHYRYALELIDRSKADLEPARAFDIYSRLHHLRGPSADQIFQRVLVAIGRRSPPRPFPEEDPAHPAPASPRSVFGQIRRRLRGRRNADLRDWVEFHTGRAETELLWTHVENAQRFVQLLEPFVGVGEAVATYTDGLEMAGGKAEIVYYLVLAHMSAGTTPSSPEQSMPGRRLTLVSRDLGQRSARANQLRADPVRRGAGGAAG